MLRRAQVQEGSLRFDESTLPVHWHYPTVLRRPAVVQEETFAWIFTSSGMPSLENVTLSSGQTTATAL
jgi:hypothetical protein